MVPYYLGNDFLQTYNSLESMYLQFEILGHLSPGRLPLGQHLLAVFGNNFFMGAVVRGAIVLSRQLDDVSLF